ncbi:MAG TPA: RNA polymerase sigma factor RpoE, partial [Marinobacter adhaerens]|nr:RNA polymerase sigma factor RpoE [Marinobacter adhaerens]
MSRLTGGLARFMNGRRIASMTQRNLVQAGQLAIKSGNPGNQSMTPDTEKQ